MEYVSLPRIIVKAGHLDIANCDRSYIFIRFWTRTFIVSSTSTTQCVHANPKMLDTSNGTTAAAVLRAQFAAVAYHGSFDRCKPMPHYTRNLLCILTETHYLNDH